jgi:hypothetical protein
MDFIVKRSAQCNENCRKVEATHVLCI